MTTSNNKVTVTTPNNTTKRWVYEPNQNTGKMRLVEKSVPNNYVSRPTYKINPVTGQTYLGTEYAPWEVRTGLWDNDGASSGSGNNNVNAASWNNYLRRAKAYKTSEDPLVYKTTNELGETVINHANLVNSDGTMHKAYQAAPGTRLGNLIQRKQNGETLTAQEEEEVRRFWASSPTAGLATTGQLGGARGVGVSANTDNGWAPRLNYRSR